MPSDEDDCVELRRARRAGGDDLDFGDLERDERRAGRREPGDLERRDAPPRAGEREPRFGEARRGLLRRYLSALVGLTIVTITS